MGLTPAWADDLDTIRYGEAARTYAAGSIQTFTPQDGVVNVITGDNQTVETACGSAKTMCFI